GCAFTNSPNTPISDRNSTQGPDGFQTLSSGTCIRIASVNSMDFPNQRVSAYAWTGHPSGWRLLSRRRGGCADRDPRRSWELAMGLDADSRAPEHRRDLG